MTEVVPTHLAIMCDGNRRWARRHQLEVFKGHERAVNNIFEPLVDQAIARGIKYLTFWIFSTENWQRAPKEVDFLMQLLRGLFSKQIAKLHKKGVRINVIGRLSDFSPDIQQHVSDAMEQTKNNTSLTLTFAMSYGGRDELVRATQKIAAEVAAGQLQPTEITSETISTHLDTASLPDPEFVIRTSGEYRTSGFLMWQSEYSELWFPEFDFPDFTPAKLDEAISEFNRRERRFGK